MSFENFKKQKQTYLEMVKTPSCQCELSLKVEVYFPSTADQRKPFLSYIDTGARGTTGRREECFAQVRLLD